MTAVSTPPSARSEPARARLFLTGMDETNMAQILKNIGIGWLVLVLVAMFATLALSLSNGRPAVLYSDQRLFALLLLPGAALLTVGLLMER
jgi:hypothetical protein